ncbi:hypothetical protein A4A49_61806, partial [Nicotiana attenuata]
VSHGGTDSLLISKCIKSEWKVPWKITNIISKIQELLVEEHGFEINHCLRESNRPGDKLPNLSHSLDKIHVFNFFPGLPNRVKGLVNMDRWNLPSFTIKKIIPSHINYDSP